MRKINHPLIVSDFDGTLVRKDGTIGQKDKAAIAEYIAAGGTFAVSTGRMPSGILPRIRELGLKGFVCCCQGAIVMDIETESLVSAGTLSNETTVRICRKMEALDLHIHVYDLRDYYSNRDDVALKIYERAVGTKAKLVTDRKISEFVKESGLCGYKAVALVAAQDNERILRALSAENFPDCEVTKSGEFLVEVVNRNYSKGTAVEALARHFSVPLDKTVAIGDQRNDLSMIKKAGIGIAVKNADGELKKAANYISEYTNEEGAIADVIERFGFTREETI